MERVVGRIGRAHGLRGELSIEIRTDEPGRRFAPGSSVIADGKPLTIKTARQQGDRLVVAFAEVPDRNAAEALRGLTLHVDVDPSEQPGDPEEFYDHQLVGLDVRTTAGTTVGEVEHVLHLPAQDTLAISIDGREVLVPFVTALVPEVDLGGGYLVIADVHGLLDPGATEPADR